MRPSRLMAYAVVCLLCVAGPSFASETRLVTDPDVAWGDPADNVTTSGGHTGRRIRKNLSMIDAAEYTTLALADAAAVAAGRELLIASNYAIADNTTLNASVYFVQGGSFTFSNNAVVTFRAGLTAGDFRIWLGTGAVKLDSLAEISPVQSIRSIWWGN